MRQLVRSEEEPRVKKSPSQLPIEWSPDLRSRALACLWDSLWDKHWYEGVAIRHSRWSLGIHACIRITEHWKCNWCRFVEGVSRMGSRWEFQPIARLGEQVTGVALNGVALGTSRLLGTVLRTQQQLRTGSIRGSCPGLDWASTLPASTVVVEFVTFALQALPVSLRQQPRPTLCHDYACAP